MKNLTLNDVKRISKEFDIVLNDFAKKHNLDATSGNIRYDDHSFKVNNVQFKVQLNKKDKETMERKDFEDLCELFDFNKKDYGKIFKVRGNTYKLIGFNLKARKYPIRCENLTTGETVRFTEKIKTVIDKG